jgi:hypothetical protein
LLGRNITIYGDGSRPFQGKSTLSWTQRTKLKEDLIQTIAYFEQLLSDQSLRASLNADSASP